MTGASGKEFVPVYFQQLSGRGGGHSSGQAGKKKSSEAKSRLVAVADREVQSGPAGPPHTVLPFQVPHSLHSEGLSELGIAPT